MSTDIDATPTERAGFFGAEVVRSIRRLITWTLVAGVLYGVFLSGSRAGCLGGLDGTGGFVGIDGEPTATEPMCYQLTLRPSLLVVGALVVVVLWALTRVANRAESAAAADRILGRAAMVALALALGSLAIGQTWFWLLPVEEWAQGGALVLPFPFASVDAVLEPLGRH